MSALGLLPSHLLIVLIQKEIKVMMVIKVAQSCIMHEQAIKKHTTVKSEDLWIRKSIPCITTPFKV